MSTARSFKYLSATALLVIFTSTAQAEIDAKKVVDTISAQFTAQGLPLIVESAELSGTNVIAKGVSIKLPDMEAQKIGDIVLENVTEAGTGYTIGKISAPVTKFEQGTDKFEFNGASINNVSIAGTDETDPVKKLFLYESMEVGPITYATGGANVFRMEGAKATMSPYVVGEALNFDVNVTGLFADLTKIPDPKTQETIASLGYTELNGVITMKGLWNPTDGRMTISESAYDFKEVGRLNLTMDFSGYTAALVTAMQAMNTSMAGKDDAAKGLAMLGLVQQLNFISMSIRFDDASVTGRALDYYAKQAGQPRDAIVNQTKAILPFIASQLQDPEFSAKVTEAASAYLDAPKSLEISAKPEAPVPFALLIATGSTTPAALIKQLNVTITANK